MSIVVDASRAHTTTLTSHSPTTLRIALLGVGHVGGALAELVRDRPLADRFTITAGLVRDVTRERPIAAHVPLTSDPVAALDDDPDIVIEALGGLEPARTLLLRAIERGIPVVTANKSLLATHGAELLATAERNAVPLRYEAAVLAGVPFLGTFGRRPLARAITGLSGIVNGTTNFIMSKMSQARTDFATALAEAQRRGYAEPDPSSDITGIDAAEKLCVLVRHFRQWNILPPRIERNGIDSITPADLDAALEFDGALKPIAHVDWSDDECSAFVAPAFVSNSNQLARVDGAQNAVVLRKSAHGELFFAGPGAGPRVTAATLLDDATEIANERFSLHETAQVSESQRIRVKPALTGWFVRVSGELLRHQDRDRLSSVGVVKDRQIEIAGETHWVALTHPTHREHIEWALHDFQSSGCAVTALRALA
jgi:homoserine dehydrogenase